MKPKKFLQDVGIGKIFGAVDLDIDDEDEEEAPKKRRKSKSQIPNKEKLKELSKQVSWLQL